MSKLNPILLTTFLLVGISFSATHASFATTPDTELVGLRNRLATNYLEPAPHLELAKYYLKKGDRLQAFFICEYARQNRFPKEIFNSAFASVFGGSSLFDNTDQGQPLFDKAVQLQKEGRLVEATNAYLRSAELGSNSAYIQMWVARFFYKAKGDNATALKYYFNAYFLDPDAYETEFVESRIRSISVQDARARFARQAPNGIMDGKTLTDPNPIVATFVAKQMSLKWQTSYLNYALDLLGHDDEEVRWYAMEAIRKNVDGSFDATLRKLLHDDDLRKRGLAAYIAAYFWKGQSFEILTDMLAEKSQLLRFDALSALSMYGGEEGLQLVIRHRSFETNPTLKDLIDRSMNRTSTQ